VAGRTAAFVLPEARSLKPGWTGGGKGDGGADKPSSVPTEVGGAHSSGRTVAGRLKQPTRRSVACAFGGWGPLGLPIWPCSARGLPCPDRRRSSGGLLPHLFTLTRRRSPGGVFSVALSLALPRLGVTQRAPTRSSDFPRPACTGRERLSPPSPTASLALSAAAREPVGERRAAARPVSGWPDRRGSQCHQAGAEAALPP
jgi:hypothetical protein